MMHAVIALARGRQRVGRSVREVFDCKGSELVAPLLVDAARIAAGTDRVPDRAQAIQMIAMADTERARALFPSLLDARQPIAVQLAVLQALANSFDRQLARDIISRWKSMSPSVRREAIEVLFSRKGGVEVVVDALDSHACTLRSSTRLGSNSSTVNPTQRCGRASLRPSPLRGPARGIETKSSRRSGLPSNLMVNP
jgi:hypothetical protein